MGGARMPIYDQTMHGAAQGGHQPGAASNRDQTAALDAAILAATSTEGVETLRTAIAALELERDSLMAGPATDRIADAWCMFEPPKRGLSNTEITALLADETGHFPELDSSPPKKKVAAARKGAPSSPAGGHNAQQAAMMQPSARAAMTRESKGVHDVAKTAADLGGATGTQWSDETVMTLKQDPVEKPAAQQTAPPTCEQQTEARQAKY